MRVFASGLTSGLPVCLAAFAFLTSAPPAAAIEPGNVIVAILDDVGIDEIPVYDGYPLAHKCAEGCYCHTNVANCETCNDCSCCPQAFDLPAMPVLQGFADSGVVFNNAYSNPTCSPTRATMQTGRYGFRTGVGKAGGAFGPRERTIPHALAAYKALHAEFPDYATAAIGKWHLQSAEMCNMCGPVDLAGYDFFSGAEANLQNFCHWDKYVVSGAAPHAQCPSVIRQIYATKDNLDDAIRWLCQVPPCGDGVCTSGGNDCADDCPAGAGCGDNMCDAPENHINCPVDCPLPACGNGACERGEDHCTCSQDCDEEDSPLPTGCNLRQDHWFLYLAFNAPHSPFQVPCGPEVTCHPTSDGIPPGGDTAGAQSVAETSCGTLCTSPTCEQADLFGTRDRMFEILDCQVKRLIDAVEQAEGDQDSVLDGTTLMVVGDNGTGFRWPLLHGKATVFEGGVRVPFIAAGKEVQNTTGVPHESEALVNTSDVFATALELMGVNLQEALAGVTVDSKSFLPILADEELNVPNPPIREFAYVEQFGALCSGDWLQAVRVGEHKLLRTCPACASGEACCFESGQADCTEKLFNVVTDVRELTDISGANQSIVNQLRNKLPGEDILCTNRPGDLCKGCCNNGQCASLTGTCGANHECCTGTYSGITVQWTGPGEPPQINEDYSVYNTIVGNQCLPHIVLKTTTKDTVQVEEYHVGRVVGGNPLPLGAVTTDWPSSSSASIRVWLGETVPSVFNVDDVATVNVDSQRGDFWSSARLDLSGDLQQRAEVSPANQVCSASVCSGTGESCSTAADCEKGGRVSGQIDGTVHSVDAYAVGLAGGTPGDLSIGALDSTSVIELVSHPADSVLIFTGYVPSGARVKVADAGGFVGDVVSTDWFDGKLCGDNLVTSGGAQNIPANIDVAFGTNGQVCDKTCTTCATPCPTALARPGPEALVIGKNRFLSFTLSPEVTGTFSIRVTLDDLPATTTPPGFDGDVPGFEGKVRYVNAFRDGGNPVFACEDSNAHGTQYKCATLDCEPDAQDWAVRVGTATLHVTGSPVMPSASYSVRAWRESMSEYDCRSPAQTVLSSTRYGDIAGPAVGPPDGNANVLDVSPVIDKVLDLVTALPEPRVWLKQQAPVPKINAIDVIDLSYVVDAVVGDTYDFVPTTCPGDSQ